MTNEDNNRPILMIGGTGRSGTTILSRIFEHHSRVAIAPEWRFMIDPDGIIDFINSSGHWSPYHADLKIKRLASVLEHVNNNNVLIKVISKLSRQYFEKLLNRKMSRQYQGIVASRYAPNFETLSNELIQKLYDFEFSGYWTGVPGLARTSMYYSPPKARTELIDLFSNYYQAIIADVLNHRQADYYLEKNTWNILWFDHIRELLPASRMIHIYRDPRDVVASFTQQSWMPTDPAGAARIYLDLYRRWEQVKSTVPPSSYLELSLEALTSQPESTLRSACEFWSIPWEPALLKTDLSRSNAGRWTKQFTSPQADTVSGILEEPLSKLGYV